MDIPALQLCSRFALSPNRLGYCGRDTAPEKLNRCILKGRGDEVSKELTKFIVLYPYIRTIAQITNQDPFSYPVIESYWLGNNLLKQFKPHHYQLLLHNFTNQGVPGWLTAKLKSKPPKAFIPFHLFNILHVGVGRASGSVPFNIQSINNCMIRWGKVKKIDPKNHQATLTLHSLSQSKPPYRLTLKTEAISYLPEFVPQLKIGSTAAAHWNHIVKVLTPKETRNLSYWTDKLLQSLPHLPSSISLPAKQTSPPPGQSTLPATTSPQPKLE